MAKLKLRPVVYCDSCPAPLTYVKDSEGVLLLWHSEAGCVRDFQMFKPPDIELEQVATSVNPQVS